MRITVIGREEGADIVLAAPRVSARHAILEPVEAGRFRVRDLDSTNGTYVNGRRATDEIVGPEDELRFGPVVFDWERYLPLLGTPGEVVKLLRIAVTAGPN